MIGEEKIDKHKTMISPRDILCTIAAILALLFFVVSSPAAPAAHTGKYLMYVGTYTEEGSESKGIYAYRYDAATGALTSLGLAAKATNPSFLAIHPNHRFLYAVNEIGNYQGKESGGVSAFAIDHTTGKLKLLNQVASEGADPCYISIDKAGKYVFVANYGGGSVAVFPILEDGRLDKMAALVHHTGHSVNPQRQEGPHAHSIDLSPDNRFAIVDDLGLDQTLIYKFGDSAALSPDNRLLYTATTKAEPGAGPRHFAFHPSGKFGYVINEMASTVSAFSYEAGDGTLHPLQTVSTIPKDFAKENTGSEIQVDPSGKFLYASNRGHDSIAAFAIDPSAGTLKLIENVATNGQSPRNFEIDPTGTRLIVGNEKSDEIVVFRINLQTGRLTPTNRVLEIAQPVCVKFVAIE